MIVIVFVLEIFHRVTTDYKYVRLVFNAPVVRISEHYVDTVYHLHLDFALDLAELSNRIAIRLFLGIPIEVTTVVTRNRSVKKCVSDAEVELHLVPKILNLSVCNIRYA